MHESRPTTSRRLRTGLVLGAAITVVATTAGGAGTAEASTTGDEVASDPLTRATPSQHGSQLIPSLPTAGPSVVGPLTANPTSPSLRLVKSTFTTMKKTFYSHRYAIDPRAGYYQWDCVGMTDWILHRAAPKAWTAMHSALKIKGGYVPNPGSWANYLRGTNGALPAGTWSRITTVNSLRPGDYLLFPPNPRIKFVGHAVIAAGPPMKLSDGSYALRVFDSTGAAHGPLDTRQVDRRAIKHSGLGNGTMRLYANPNGTFNRAAWSMAGRPNVAMTNTPVVVGRALR